MRRKPNPQRRGAITVIALIAIVMLSALAAAILATMASHQDEVQTANGELRAFYAAEAGANALLADVRATATALGTGQSLADVPLPAAGSKVAPLDFSGGRYHGDVNSNGDETYTILCVGEHGTSRQAVEVVVGSENDGIFSNAVFAGNSSGDPNYTMEFGGTGGQADFIDGEVYSGGDIVVTDDASISGPVGAQGTITGTPGQEGVSQKIPDIASMNYETTSDVDVAAEFASGGAVHRANGAGGDAWELPEDNPAHIFRLHPSDRAASRSGTAKDDYYLEDPYEPANKDVNQDGTNPYEITLTGGSKPGPDGNRLVYFIDGNLWLHNNPTFSFQFRQPGGTNGVQVTIVVKGNIYISDNIFYENPATDGLALMAIKDPNEPDSGNFYFGDLTGGTLEHMDAYMYAENNFYDQNLDASGSKNVHVNGLMSAGNQVAIDRDYNGQHSQLGVTWDSRVHDGTVTLPGLPSSSGAGGAVTVLSWRRVPAP